MGNETNTADDRRSNHPVDYLLAPVWNRRDRRLRAPWRIALALALVLGGVLAVSAPLVDAYGPFVGNLLAQLASVGIAGATLLAWSRVVDRRPLSGYGLAVDRAWIKDLLAGLGIGAAIHAVAFAAMLAGGYAEVTAVAATGSVDASFPVAFVGFAVAFACVGVWEELLFRGVFLTNAAEGLSRFSRRTALAGALAVSSSVFALLHVGQVTTPAAFAFWTLLGGGLLGTAYLLTGRLGLPIGIHAAYNFAGNNVFGLTGVVDAGAPTLVELGFTGPAAVVGIPGVLNAAAAVVGVLLVVAWVRWRHGEVRLRVELTEWRTTERATR